MYQGPRKGEVVWTDLKLGRVSYILRNPRYTGAYVYGRRTQKRRDAQGNPVVMWLPEQNWHTLIKDFHARYISWDEYEENLKRLQANRRSGDGYNRTAPREGPALLQGMALCGIWGSVNCARPREIMKKSVARTMSVERSNAGKDPFVDR